MRNNQNGQTLIEVIVASVVGILVVTALVFATIFSLRNASFAKNSAQATKLAQEGIERVRSGRDRNQTIGGGFGSVMSWDGSSATSCSGLPTVRADSIWCQQITGSGLCDDNPPPSVTGVKCYFRVDLSGVLTYIDSSTSFPSSFFEGIPSAANPIFKRVVLLSDETTTYTTQKTVTVIVQWTDFAGPHESRLTTILRKL